MFSQYQPQESLRQLLLPAELTAAEHPADEAYLADSRSERPSPRTEARELWFATSSVWERNSDFLETISKA